MENHHLKHTLLPLALFLAVIYTWTGNMRSEASSADCESYAQRNLGSAEGLILEYFDAKKSDIATCCLDADCCRCNNIEYLIATFPDPEESHLGALTDIFLASIQRAIETAGYVMDRFDLPWLYGKEDAKEAKESSGKQPSEHIACLFCSPGVDSCKKDDESPKGPRYTRAPGVILFRSLEEPRKLLVLFLVGETPTAGIHKEALVSALGQVAKRFCWRGHGLCFQGVSCSPNVKLLGPVFSGSADSLKIGLNRWLESKCTPLTPHVKIISGSATAIDKGQLEKSIGTGSQATFHATVPLDRDVLDCFISDLRESRLGCVKGGSSPDIAMLSENTSYGQSLATKDNESNYLFIPFPLHISRLRSVSGKESVETKDATLKTKNNSQNNSIPWEAAQKPKDMLPSFSQLEVCSMELALQDILSVLSREKIHYVGILATDVLDRIFLAREVRKYCPNTVLFTTNADFLYLHREVNGYLQGMRIISPYPLFSLNQLWTFPFLGDKSRLQFPNELAQGVYNATLALLGQEGKMLEYGQPFEMVPSRCQNSCRCRKPPTWVTVVGRNGFWPVKLLKFDNCKDCKDYLFKVGPSCGDRNNIKLSRGSLSEISFIGLLAFGLFFLILPILPCIILEIPPFSNSRKSNDSGGRSRAQSEWLWEALGDRSFLEQHEESRFVLFVGFLIFSGVCLFVVIAISILGMVNLKLDLPCLAIQASSWPVFFLLLIFTIALLLSTFASFKLFRGLIQWGICRWRIICGWGKQNWLYLIIALLTLGSSIIFILALFLIVLIIALWIYQSFKSPADAFFTHLRLTNLVNGLSPLLPIFFSAIAGVSWVICSMRRLRMLEGMKCPSSFLDFHEPSFKGIKQMEAQVRDLLAQPSHQLPQWYVVSAIALVVSPVFLIIPFQLYITSIDGDAYDWLFLAASVLVYGVLALAFVRFVCLWVEFRRLLRRLSWHPMMQDFTGYSERFPGLPKVDLTRPTPTFTMLEFSVERARHLFCLTREVLQNAVRSEAASSRSLSEKFPSGLRTWLTAFKDGIENAEKSLYAALEARANEDWPLCLCYRHEAQKALSQISQKIAIFLEPHWPLPDSYSSPLKKEDTAEEKWLKMSRDFLLLRAIHFIWYILPQLQNLVYYVLAGLLLMMLAVNSYPFQPQSIFSLFNWSVVIIFVSVTLMIFVQMSRDRFLSFITETSPGRVSWTRDFVLRILTYGLLPVLGLLGAQFPEVIRQILSWIGLMQAGGAGPLFK